MISANRIIYKIDFKDKSNFSSKSTIKTTNSSVNYGKSRSPYLNAHKELRYSPNSSLSSFGGQSNDFLSQTTTQESLALSMNTNLLNTTTTQTWSKDAIKTPLDINITDKKMRKQAINLFKLIQSYMGDRKLKSTKLTPDNVNRFFCCFFYLFFSNFFSNILSMF